jgi:hypothetical protein
VTFVVLLILAVIWALYLASWMRSRAQVRSRNSISSFNQHLSVLERARPAGLGEADLQPVAVRSLAPRPHDPLVRPPQVNGLLSGAPITLRDARRRRRDILLLLIGVTAVAATLYMLVGGVTVYLLAASGGAMGGYIFLLLRAQSLAAERAEKVHYLHQADDYGYAYEYDDASYEYEPAFAGY